MTQSNGEDHWPDEMAFLDDLQDQDLDTFEREGKSDGYETR